MITRSPTNTATRQQRNAETYSAAGEQFDGSMPSTADGCAPLVDVRSSTPPLAGLSLSAGASAPSPPPLYGREMPGNAQLPQHGQAPPVSAPQPVMMSDQQLVFLLQTLRSLPPTQGAPPPPPPTVSTNLSNCSARFNGAGDVIAFIDNVTIYKDCVGVSDSIALRGLPMLFTDIAATWWQGVKHSVSSWEEALHLLRQTFGPRLPPPRIYREIFSREQGEERTDVFVCRVRALIAQLPPNTLPENPVQLDMVYGLLHKRIRERVARNAFSTFAEMLQLARVAEDVLEEGRISIHPKRTTPAPVSPSTTLTPTASPAGFMAYSDKAPPTSKPRPRCTYCKTFGHNKDECRKLVNRQSKTAAEPIKTEPVAAQPELRPSLTCFGCGAPGVIRANCAVCKERLSVPSTTTSFQSVSAVDNVLSPRVRPLFDIEVFGKLGTALLDTGAKQSVASESLTSHLRKNGQVFRKVETELKFADGSRRIQVVETASVIVKVQGVATNTLFMVLPGATESLLGMNFIRDAGMMLDFEKGHYSLRSTGLFKLKFERDNNPVVTSTIGLRECEGTLLSSAEREKLAALLEENSDIFNTGGGPTPFAVHRIDTGNATPISTPPYRVTPAKKEIIRAEIDKMLELGVIEEAESEWASPVVLVPKKNGETRFCVDYRKLNAVTRTDKYPLPLIDDILASTKSNCVMSTIDLKSGYWQVEESTDKARRPGPTYQEGDLVLVESHRLSQAARGFTSAPRREGPYRITKVVSPTTYEVQDRDGRPRGKYHASLLNAYVGDSDVVVHTRKKGRPRRKLPNPKPAPSRSAGLEGEDIAQSSLVATPRTSKRRRVPPARPLL
ncbi:hypothetical protein ABMA28_016992 [Loxostege sticticalis]|uniref:Uncharacterized protein n=1 Tax=Loxostege sticticalis TaxID=481309 RepID=A0ABD0TAG7_LOXSC